MRLVGFHIIKIIDIYGITKCIIYTFSCVDNGRITIV